MELFYQTALFFFSVLIFFYLPGRFISLQLKFKLSTISKLFFNTALGLLVFTFAAYILSWLKISWLLLTIFITISLVSIFHRKIKIKTPHIKNIAVAAFLLLSSLIFSSPQFLCLPNSNYFCGLNGDDIWHLALINELQNNFPPENPAFADVTLKGYHYFSDFVNANLSRSLFIEENLLYFVFIPILLSLLWSLGAYSLLKEWTNKTSAGLWAVFLTMLGGSFAYIIYLQGHTSFNLDSGMGIAQPVSSMNNQPFSYSIVILIFTLFSLLHYSKTKNKKWLIPVALGAGLVAMFKVYAGLIILISLLLIGIFDFFRKKLDILYTIIIASLLFAATYWVLRDPASKLIFYPFWAPHNTLIDNFPWYGYIEKQYTYSTQSVIKGLIEIELFAFSVFILGNLGSRIFGLFCTFIYWFKGGRVITYFGTALSIMTIISLLVPLLFIQSGKVFEIIQMGWYFLFLSSIIAAHGLIKIFDSIKNRYFKIILIILIVASTLPSTIYRLSGVYNLSIPRSRLELPALNTYLFLRDTGNYNENVLEIPDLGGRFDIKSLRQWYNNTSPKIPALANKRSYLSNQFAPYYGTWPTPRLRLIQKIIKLDSLKKNTNAYNELYSQVENTLKSENITYIVSPTTLNSPSTFPFLKKIYNKDGIEIYKNILNRK